MKFSLSGKTAIVTGAAAGCGLAIGRHFIEAGANVMFTDMDEHRLEAAVSELHPDRARMFAGDVRETLTIKNLLSATVDAFDGIDILINASRQVLRSDLLDPEADQVETMLGQNLLPALRLSQMTARRMISLAERRERTCVGAIVNLSSIAATRAQPEIAGYSIACAAQDQMTRALALTLAPKGIRVNAVAFGSVLSDSLRGALADRPDLREPIVAATPLGRIADAAELVEAVQFLASDAASFMTGQIVSIDGGRSLLDAVRVPAH
ncbi:SDR family NAD(P)-dependent oxidoreductase [Falsirhodobacter algicola]|uniref:SDR family oxidoreductase n=1 Tax=Falsirhodobacter algicola TaxID=2692330 RepID=A0A8J8SK02_9RHOB|nr:SDR family oxidoreductase [Falsirhodobacter algicola]QUS34842.1 SDR family oxidoreductase [Falsirhodobacter algicola]